MRPYVRLSSILACIVALFSLAAPAQTVTVSPASISFGNQVEGTTSAVHKVTLTNGQTSAITISTIATSLSDYPATNNCPVSPSTLAAAATCTISITFKPSAVGTRAATLTVTDTGASSPQKVTLTGTGIAPSLTSIAVTPAAPSVAAGNTEQFTATGTYSDGTTKNLTSTATWTSSATGVATVSSAGLATSVATGTATIAAQSGTIKGSATLTVTAAVLTSIAVAPSTASVAAGRTEQFTATGTYSNGTTKNLTSTATWTSSATGVATVSSAGLATSVATGTATIAAQSGTIKGSATLTVTAAVLTSIAVTPSTASVAAGHTEQFTATGTYSNGTTQNLTSTASWTSSATGVATVNSAGLATSVATGTATIAAQSGTIKGSATLTVTAAVLTSIAVTPSTASVAAGHTEQFTATGTYSNGTTQNLTSTATWTSSAITVATVSASGLATALIQGSSTISAASGTIVGSAALTVTVPVLASIAVSPASASIAKGNSQQFTATGTFSNGSTQNLTSSVTWSSSSSSVAGVGAGGLASGLAVGSASITATLGTVAGSATLTVGQAMLVSIAVTPANGSFALGTTLPMVATGTYSDGSTLVLTTTATWNASNTAIATVNAQGIASGGGVGNTMVTATVGTISGSTTVTVNPAALVSIAVTPAIPTVPLGTTQQFAANGSFTDGTTQDVTSTVQWSIANTVQDTPAVGSMSATTPGLFSSEGTGSANITATSGSISGSTQLTVSAAALVSIAVTPADVSIALGTSQQFTATGTFTDQSTQDLTGSVTWSSDTPAAVAIQSSGGLAQGRGQGTATVSATSGSTSGSTQLTVTAAALVSIAITPATATIPMGTTQQFTATGTFTDGTTQDLTQNGQWTSSAGTVATISDSPGTMGLASPLTTGTTTIGISSGGVSATASLVVNPAALVSIAVSPPTASIALGTTQQFTATGTYTDHSTQDLTSVVTWSSSSSSAAIISNTLGSYGLATSAGQGITTITATSNTISASGALTVTGPSLVSIAITPSSTVIPLGESLQFDAVGMYTDGSTQDLTQTATWASSVPTVAAIGASGYVGSILPGTTVISATSQGVNGLANVTVTAPVLMSIAVAPVSASIAKGNGQQFTATGTYTDQSTQDLTSVVTWSSSSSSVARVGAGGLASGLAVGSASITATSGTVAGSATLTVGQAMLVSIAVTPANGSFALGTTLPMVATGTYSDGSTLVLTTTATWNASNTAIATVNAQGIASGGGVGNTTVTATVGTISGSTTVTVNPAALVSIAVTPAIPTVPLGTTQQFAATGSFTDGTTQDVTSTVQWSIANTVQDTPAVGSMSATTPGLFSSEGTGSANITATAGSISGSTQLTVSAAALVSIAVTPADVSIALGTSQQFTAMGTFTDQSTQDLTGSVTWSSDTPAAVAIQSSGGLAQGRGQGTATVSATSGTVSGSTQLTVTAAALVSIAITPATATIPMGTTQQFTATGTFTDGTTQDLTQNGQWTSSVGTVATISDSPGTMGLASPLTTGTTTIGISSGGVSATASLVVNPAALVSIAVSPPTASIALGTTQQFTATGTYTDQSTQDLTSVVTWSSSSSSAAIISNTLGSYGLATSAGQGITTITATSNTISASGSLTVTGPSLVSIAITPSSTVIPLGESLQFDAVGMYTDGSTQDLTQTATWASSVPTVAAIGASGYVGSILPGTTVISASSGSVTSATALTVNSPVPVSLVVTPATASILTGAQQQFTATLDYSDGSSVNVSATVTWSSLDYSIASVSSTGLVAGITNGSTSIVATWGGNVFTAEGSIAVSAPVPNTWYVSPQGNDANNCLSSSSPCLTLAQAESLSAAGDTITLAAGTYRLSPGGSSTAGQIVPKSNQTFTGPPCSPTSAPCLAVISGGVSIGGLASGPDALGNWSVTGQTQQGEVNTVATCDTGWGACIYPEDLFFNGVPLQHVVASSEPVLAANQWWFDYTNHIIYFSQNPAGNTVETSVLETAFYPNGANNVTVKNLTVEEFAAPLQLGAIAPTFGSRASISAGINWTIENSYLTLNHGGGVEVAFGMQILNNVVTKNGDFGISGGLPAGAGITPSGLLVQGNTITYNNYAYVSPNFGAGGMKFGNTAYAVVRNNTITNNLGNGVHFDEDSLFPLIDGNTITDNADPVGQGGAAGIMFEIGFGGATVRNNIVQHNGDTAISGPDPQIVSAASAGMQAYCNVIEPGANSHEYAFVVSAGNRGYNTNQPYLGAYIGSTGNYVHHNTVIWDAGSTALTGYFQYDATNQPNFFSLNSPPNYNQYHASSTGLSLFVYGNVNGDNQQENFQTYQSLGADVNSTLDTLNTSGFPTVSITSPADQSSVSNGFSVAASAFDPGGISRVEFFVDWNLAGTMTASPYNFTVGGLSTGPHTIAAMAFNNAGIQSCYAITVND